MCMCMCTVQRVMCFMCRKYTASGSAAGCDNTQRLTPIYLSGVCLIGILASDVVYYTHAGTYTPTYTCSQTHCMPCTCTYTCTYTHRDTYTVIHPHIQLYMQSHTYIAFARTHIRACTNAHRHIYTCI